MTHYGTPCLCRRLAAQGAHLSAREHEALALVARGLTNEQIARCLGVSDRTAQSHVASLLAKTQSFTRTQIAVEAVQCALVTMPTCDAAMTLAG